MVKIGYVIPLHKKDDRVFRALDSVPNESEVFVVGPEDVINWLNKKVLHDNTFLYIEEDTSYQSLCNAGISELIDRGCEFISILEYDDVLMHSANKIINEYAEHYPDVDVFAPISFSVKENESNKPSLIGVLNDSCFSPGLPEEDGFYDFNMMLRSNFLFINGCYIKPSVFEDNGKFKNNIKVFADYEFSLRMVYNGVIIKGIPKASRMHYLYDDSMFGEQKLIDSNIINEWLAIARKEYFFIEDREVSVKS